MPSESVSLPGAKLRPGPDDDLIKWRNGLRRRNISVSAKIKEALRVQYIQPPDQDNIAARLDRIEAILQQLAQGVVVQPEAQPSYKDPILSADL